MVFVITANIYMSLVPSVRVIYNLWLYKKIKKLCKVIQVDMRGIF